MSAGVTGTTSQPGYTIVENASLVAENCRRRGSRADVDRFEAEVAPAAVELVGNKTRRHGVAPGSHVSFAQDFRHHVFAIKIFARVRRQPTPVRWNSPTRCWHTTRSRGR